MPYLWTGPDALEDVRPDELSEITPDDIEKIDEVLKPFGWRPEPERAPLPAGGESDTLEGIKIGDWRKLKGLSSQATRGKLGGKLGI
jgi:hypothetical protein